MKQFTITIQDKEELEESCNILLYGLVKALIAIITFFTTNKSFVSQ